MSFFILPSNLAYRLQQSLCVILFCLIVLGAGVRLANAGLACPDWPLCFGEVVPRFNFQIFMEWIHRVVAMCSGLIALVVSISIWSNPVLRARLGVLAVFSILLFGFQAFLGRQTVLQFLKSETVTAHLMGGYSLLALNLLIFLNWKPHAVRSLAPKAGMLSMLLLSFLQATLGGVVSAHYAGHACPDFPTCQGEWWPELTGVVGIHFIHRLGAFVLLLSSLFVFLRTANPSLRKWAAFGTILISLQIFWGILMVFNEIHPALSLLHSATALSVFTCYFIGAHRACSR